MTKNVGTPDRIIRFVLAALALFGASSLGFSSLLGIILTLVAIVLAVTGVVGFCPIYRVLGMKTNAPKQ